MKFLCDVHISYKLVSYLLAQGLECIHVNNILDKWHTKDHDICAFADKNDLVVITKDADFRDSFLVKSTPKKLIKINLGNVSNVRLIGVFEHNITAICKFDDHPNFLIEVDLNRISYIVR